MKSHLKTLLLYIVIVLGACNSFDEAAFTEGLKSNEEQAYKVPMSIPETEAQFATFLHNDSQLKWMAREFKLVDLVEFQNCRLDDAMTLNNDGTYHFDGGTMSCGGDDVPTRSGVYRHDYSKSQLIFDEGSTEEVIVEVSGLDDGIIALSGKVMVMGVNMTIEGVYTAEK